LNDTKKIKIILDIDDYIDIACNIFGIEDDVGLESSLEVFKERLSLILENKLQKIANCLNIYEFVIKFKFTGASVINLLESFSDENNKLLFFNIHVYNKQQQFIGEFNKYNLLTIHKFNILDCTSEVSGYVPQKADLIDAEPDFLTRINNCSIEHFLLKDKYVEYIENIFSGVIEHASEKEDEKAVHSLLFEKDLFLNFKKDFSDFLIYVHDEKIYDCSLFRDIEFEYIIAEDKEIRICMNEHPSKHAKVRNVQIYENDLAYKDNNGFKNLVFNIFVKIGILDSVILKDSDNFTYKEAFEISGLMKY